MQDMNRMRNSSLRAVGHSAAHARAAVPAHARMRLSTRAHSCASENTPPAAQLLPRGARREGEREWGGRGVGGRKFEPERVRIAEGLTPEAPAAAAAAAAGARSRSAQAPRRKQPTAPAPPPHGPIDAREGGAAGRRAAGAASARADPASQGLPQTCAPALAAKRPRRPANA